MKKLVSSGAGITHHIWPQEDPVKDGLVASFNHPGGNLTGVTFLGGLVGGRRVQLLHDLTPQAGVIALLIDANNITSAAKLSDLEGAVHAIGLNSVIGKVASELEIDAAFATFAQQRAGALVVGNSPFFTSHIKRIVALAARNALPASYQQREFAEVGGLMSYGSSLSDATVRPASMPLAFLKVSGPLIFRSCRRPSSSWW
jgi:putative tryptophan/tyrosine transport system substrate-binding protein